MNDDWLFTVCKMVKIEWPFYNIKESWKRILVGFEQVLQQICRFSGDNSWSDVGLQVNLLYLLTCTIYSRNFFPTCCHALVMTLMTDEERKM